MNPADAEVALFGDALACEEVRPATFVPGLLDGASLRSSATRGEALLRALAVVEDGARVEDPEQPVDHALHRVEAKLDLLTAVVASLVANHDVDPPTALRWSAQGACLGVDAPLAAGTEGCFRVRPTDWLPSPLVLPATVLACDADSDGRPRAWLRFDGLSPALAAALERHLFRIHRRAIAESRRPR